MPLPNAGRGRHLASQHPLPGWHWEPEDDVAHPPAPEAESGGGTEESTRLLRPRPRPSPKPAVLPDLPAAFPTNRAEAPDIPFSRRGRVRGASRETVAALSLGFETS